MRRADQDVHSVFEVLLDRLPGPMFTTMLEDGYDHGMIVLDPPPEQLGADMGRPIAAMVRALAAAGKTTGKQVNSFVEAPTVLSLLTHCTRITSRL
jgi:hypothetical protein